MKFLFDLFPVILFFAAFKLFDIYVATAVAIAATFLQIGWLKWRRRKVDTMMWVTLIIIVVFGGATLALHDETFIKWKPTVLYWLFGAVLGAAELLFRKNLKAGRRPLNLRALQSDVRGLNSLAENDRLVQRRLSAWQRGGGQAARCLESPRGADHPLKMPQSR